jgi:glutathione-regulated potassium-efflux system ancillary protein KefC
VINQAQYSHLVATVIGTAIIPTAIANAWFMPRHLLPGKRAVTEREAEMVEEDLQEMP